MILKPVTNVIKVNQLHTLVKIKQDQMDYKISVNYVNLL